MKSLAFLLLICSGISGQVVHRRPVPLSAAPVLPAAGSKAWTDFGTEVFRLTDDTDGQSCWHGYSYWSAISRDNTKIVVSCLGGPRIVTIDPAKLTRLSSEPLPAIPNLGVPNVESAHWSALEASRLWVPFGSRIFRWSATTKEYEEIKNLAANCPGGLRQWSISADEQTFAGTCVTASGKHPIVWRRDSDTILYSEAPSSFDECQTDKSGRYLLIKPADPKSGQLVRLIDLWTKRVQKITAIAPDFGPGHSDMGQGVLVQASGYSGYAHGRTLEQFALSSILTSSIWFEVRGAHVSMRGGNENWALFSVSHLLADRAKAFANEFFFVSADGTRRVWRVGRHYPGDGVFPALKDSSYWSIPRAVASWDQSFVIFSSQNGTAGGRVDVYGIKSVSPK
ncbi:MAG TPA: hypothetical protein VFO36_03370, partial [Nitrospiraceae bacterium]|nr:hypothetical protein [Nitrospiraceae bacterium]